MSPSVFLRPLLRPKLDAGGRIGVKAYGMKNLLLLTLGLGLALAAHAAAPALETRVLSDMNLPGEWQAHQWNKAQGRVMVRAEFPEELKTEAGQKRESLGMKISWPGGEGFRFFSIEPAKADPIPFKVVEASFWLKGSATAHSIEFHFNDAGGNDVKVGPGAKTDFPGWKKISVKIPAAWQQPLTVRTITFHDWSNKEAAEVTMYATRYEVVVDPSEKLGGAAGSAKPVKTNDTW